MNYFTHALRWIISYITVLILIIVGSVIYFYEPPISEIDLPTTTPPFYYPLTEPVFIHYEDIMVSYEYIDDGRHLVAIENNGERYIMPLFPDKETALDFMNRYFSYLKEVEK